MTDRIVLGTKKNSMLQPRHGLIWAIAEEVDGKIYPITSENFCPTKQVFIVDRYEEIEAKFQANELFKIRVRLNHFDAGQEKSKYIAFGDSAEKLRPNEIAEIITAELPDRNIRRLITTKLPGTKYIFIQNNSGEGYGPVEWEEKNQNSDEFEVELKIITSGGLGKIGGNKRLIGKIQPQKIYSNQINFETDTGKKTFVQNVSNIVAGATLEEYANDKEIIEEVRKMAGESVGRTIDRKNFETLINLVSNNRREEYPLKRNRITIFNSLIKNNAELLGGINDLLETYLKHQSGIKIIENHIEENRGKYIDRLKNEKEQEINNSIKNRQEELSQIKLALEEFRKERTRLSDEIETKRKELEKDVLINQKTAFEKISKEHEEKISAMNSEEEAAKNRIEEIKSRIREFIEVDDIQKSVIKRQAVLEHIQQQIEDKRKERDAVLEESRKAEDDIRKKLRGMKPYVDHLNGTFTGDDLKKPDIKVACADLKMQDEVHARRSVIDSVQTHLASLGRIMDDQEIANILISTQQSFITFLAGLPGVGKTSACKSLAQAQGLEKRLLSVSVARGWTSIKDIIGFHNPLNDQFQPAATGMYEFLRTIGEESRSGNYSPMSYILLDEANLSSIEHYWSSFMGMTDSTTAETLPVGKDSLLIPRNLRFLATINYDGTTEVLSPRILNRASVIVMRPGEISPRQIFDKASLQPLPIASVNMDALFGLFDEAPELEIEEKSALEAIIKVLCDSTVDKGRSIHISQRKINAIRQYCGRARSVMRSDGNSVTALDWAVMQHVLPQISGHGVKFGNRLLALKKCLEDQCLEMSSNYLDQMISHGQNDLHSYDFFSW